MPYDLAMFTELPGLREWLISDKWKIRFNPATLHRGAGYVSRQSIRQIEIRNEPLEGGLILSALIYGSAPNPYQADLLFRLRQGGWSVDPDCSCPVGFLCKHTAALLTFIAFQLSNLSQPSEDSFDPMLGEWLEKIEAAAQAQPLVALGKLENRFLAYCIEQSSYRLSPGLNLVLRVGTRQKDGSVQISESRASADLWSPPKYMIDEDLVITTLYHQRARAGYFQGDMALSGDGWKDLLERACATGRLYYAKSSAQERNSVEYQVLSLGPVLAVEATWQAMPNGSAQPVLQCGNPDLIIIPCQPLRYLNPVSATLGLLESALSMAILNAWQNGPVVSASNFAAISTRVAAISTVNLPTPVEVPSVTRPASAPQAHLRIYSRTLGRRWESKAFIVGQISFRYSDSKLLTPLVAGQLQSHLEIRDHTRVLWPRDFHQEQILTTQLQAIGFSFLSEIISVSLLDTAGLHSVVVDNRFPSERLEWLNLLGGVAMQGLRDSGWSIETDPELGLIAYDASEFFPAIEADPDHGIDWFRFDISFEMNGQKLSLIPIIATAIQMDLPAADDPNLPDFFTLPGESPEAGFIRFPAKRLIEIVDQVRHLFHGNEGDGTLRLDRLAAAGMAETLAIDSSATTRALAQLGHRLKNITALPLAKLPKSLHAELRPYQLEGYRWLQFLAGHGLHGILADDMGLGKTIQTLAHLAAERAKNPGLPSLVIAPTSVVPNWAEEAAKFTPKLKLLVLQGQDRATMFGQISAVDIVITSYPLLTRDFEVLSAQNWHLLVLDEAQYIKNPKALSAQNACKLKAAHRLCLSGTPMENHLGELWSLMRFLMPGFLADEKSFNARFRRPIERDRCGIAQQALSRRISSLILRRTKDQVATDLPEKTEIIHGINLHKKQSDLYESIRAAMDKRVRDAIAAKGLSKSHIIVLDALLKLRQICCHPQLLKSPAAQKVTDSAKLSYLTDELLPTLIEEGRRILLFSTFTSMLALIEKHLIKEKIVYLKLTGQTGDRASLVKKFQTGEVPIFLISLKAGGTGLNLTAADTVIHYDPWWNPAAENQATDRAHRIGQNKPVFVHKLVCRGTIEDRILELQKHKSALIEALLSDETSKLKIDAETLSHLLSPLD